MLSELKDFLLTRDRALDAANPRSTSTAPPSSSKARQVGNCGELLSHATSVDISDGPLCPLCRERHALRTCGKFKALPVEHRREHVRKKKA